MSRPTLTLVAAAIATLLAAPSVSAAEGEQGRDGAVGFSPVASVTGRGGRHAVRTCTVPKLAGKTLPRAKQALWAAGCKLGKVHRPRPRKGLRLPLLVVKSSSPRAGARPASATVNLVLAPRLLAKSQRSHRRSSSLH